MSSLLAALRPFPPLPSSDGQVILRPWRLEDADFLLTSFADDQVREMAPLAAPIDFGIAQRWIRDHAARGARPSSPAFLIVDAAGARLGAIGATSIDWNAHHAEFFYWVLAPYRGRGLATRALQTISEWALAGGLANLQLMIDTSNQVSAKVALGAGYRFTHMHPAYRMLGGHLIDAAAYVRQA